MSYQTVYEIATGAAYFVYSVSSHIGALSHVLTHSRPSGGRFDRPGRFIKMRIESLSLLAGTDEQFA